MRSPSEPRRWRRWVFLAALCLAVLGPFLPLQPAEAQGLDPELALELEQQFEVVPLQNGLGLIPRQPRFGVRMIELRGATVAVNGQQVTEEVLRSWLGAEAEPVLRLMELPPPQRRTILDAPPVPEPTPPTPPVGEPEPAFEEEAAATPPEPAAVVEEPAVAAAAPAAELEEFAPLEEPPLPEEPAEETPLDDSWRHEPSDKRFAVGNSVTIQEDEVAAEVTVIGGDLRVEGRVADDAVAIGGRVDIEGVVEGDVGAIGGKVRLHEGARVLGNVLTLGGTVEREEGAQVLGEISEVSFGRGMPSLGNWFDWDDWRVRPWAPWSGVDAFEGVSSILFLCIVTCLVLLLAPGPVERVEKIVAREPWKAGLVGLIASLIYFVLLPIVGIVLVVTIIGIPVLLIIVLGYVVLALIGYTTVAKRLGHLADKRFGWSFKSPYALACIGVVLIQIWSVLADASSFGWPFFFILFTFALFGWMVKFSAWMVGLGGVLLSFIDRGPAVVAVGVGLPPLPGDSGEVDLPPLPDVEELEREFDEVLEEAERVGEEAERMVDNLENRFSEGTGADSGGESPAAEDTSRKPDPPPEG